MCPREVKFYVYTKTCTEMLMAALLFIKLSSKGVNKLWNITQK